MHYIISSITYLQYCVISDRPKLRAWQLVFMLLSPQNSKESISVNLVLFLKLSVWLSRDKCVRHTISRLLHIVNVNSMAAPRKELSKDLKEVVVTLYLHVSGLPD